MRRGCLLFAVLVALAAPTGAQAVWTAPVVLSEQGLDSSVPDVALDQSGNAVFVWLRFDGTTDCGGFPGCERAQVRARSAAGVLSAVQTLSGAGRSADSAGLAVDSSGNAVVVWRRSDHTTACEESSPCERVQTRARSATAALSAAQTLSAPGRHAYSPDVAVDPSGNAVFAWTRLDGTGDCGFDCQRAQTRARSAAGALSATQTLSAAGHDAYGAQVGVDQSGNAVFAWVRPDPATGCSGFFGCVQARARSAAGVLSAPQRISAPGQEADSHQLAVDPSGNAIFVWQRRDGTTGCEGSPGCLRIQARFRSAGGALSMTQTLSPAGQHAYAPAVAVDQSGNAVFVWLVRDETGCGGFPCLGIQARARSAAGVLSPIQTLSAPANSTDDPQVAVDQSGNAIFVWQRAGVIEARARSDAGTLSATQTLSNDAGADSPDIAVNPTGKAAAAWRGFAIQHRRIYAAFGP
jgi:hypothetical protein